MANYGEINPEACMPEMPDGFIEADIRRGRPNRFFYVPDLISHVSDRTGRPFEGTFRLCPDSGAVVEETAYVAPTVSLGRRVVICANVDIEDDVQVGNRVLVADRVFIDTGVQIGHRAIIGRKSRIRSGCSIGVMAIVSDRCDVGEGSVIEFGAIVPSRKIIPPGSVVTKAHAREASA